MAYPACEAICSPASDIRAVRCEATHNAEAAGEAVRVFLSHVVLWSNVVPSDAPLSVKCSAVRLKS